MKDSEVEWIGEIPKDWDVVKGKFVFSQRNDRGNAKSLCLLSPTQKYGVIPQDKYEELTGMKAVKLNEKTNLALLKTIHVGDFCISLRSFQGGFEYSEYEGVVSPAYQIFFPYIPSERRFFKYLFKDQAFIDKMNSFTLSLRDGKNIAFADFANSYLAIPNHDEQTKIADFLDRKCSEIDALTADIQTQIETLEEYKKSVITEAVTKGLDPNVEMKDSGVEWIGKIPKEWSIKKIRYVTKSISDIDHYMPNDSYDDNSIPYLMIGDLKDKTSKIDFEQCKHVSYHDYKYLSSKIKNQIDDVIFARYATIGTATYIDINKDFLVSYACLTIKTHNNMYGKFLFYYFKSKSFLEDVSQYINSNTQGNIGKDSLSRTKIVVPPIKEQLKIADFLDQKCSEIDLTISEKQEQLETLAEYKKSLIYEYVTGKKEVA